jgi:NAD(P)H dehydrogenase (quinone)
MDALVGEDLTIRGPAGDGKVSVVAREDIARVAAAVLRDPGAHRDATYYMTGPEALSMTEVARALTLARGQTVTFHDETIPEAYESRRRWGAPDWQNDAWVSTYTAIASGDLAAVSDDVETITGRRPLTLAEFLLARPHA